MSKLGTTGLVTGGVIFVMIWMASILAPLAVPAVAIWVLLHFAFGVV